MLETGLEKMHEVFELKSKNSDVENKFKDVFFELGMWIVLAVVLFVACFVYFDVFQGGLKYLSLEFLFDSPKNNGLDGGINSILIGTLMIVSIALCVAVPVGLANAIWVSDYMVADSRYGHYFMLSLDVLAAIPTVVLGLFGNAFFCFYLKMGYSILSGALTLAIMVLPLFTRTCVDALRAVPKELRLSGIALGMPQIAIIFKLIIPYAKKGIIAAVVLAIARALAETAALVFTAGYVDRMPGSIFDSARTVSVHIYDLALNVPGGEERAYGVALVLLIVILFINSILHFLSKQQG